MALPTELVHHICRFDTALLEWYYIYSNKNIIPSDCTTPFLFHLSSTDNIDLFTVVFKKMSSSLTLHLMNMLFEEAIMCESVRVFRFLIDNWNFQEDTVRQYLSYAIHENCASIIPPMFEKYPYLIDSATLEEAVYRNDYSLVKYILNHPLYAESSADNHAFIIAIQMSHRKIFRFMLTHSRVDAHEPDNEPLKQAIYSGNPWFVRELMQDPYVRANLQLDTEEDYLLRQIYRHS